MNIDDLMKSVTPRPSTPSESAEWNNSIQRGTSLDFEEDAIIGNLGGGGFVRILQQDDAETSHLGLGFALDPDGEKETMPIVAFLPFEDCGPILFSVGGFMTFALGVAGLASKILSEAKETKEEGEGE